MIMKSHSLTLNTNAHYNIIGRYSDVYIVMLRLILKQKNMSLYKLEKSSMVSHATLSDLYNEKTNVDKCSCSLLYSLSKALDIDMDTLYQQLTYQDLSYLSYSESFDLYKSHLCHELKYEGYEAFLNKYVSTDEINTLYKRKKIPEAIYLLSLIDYLCRLHNLSIKKEYQSLREIRLDKLYVSKGLYLLIKTKSIKISDIYKESIDEFLSHNIVEADIDDVN